MLKVWQAILKYETFVNIIQGTLTETIMTSRKLLFYILRKT